MMKEAHSYPEILDLIHSRRMLLLYLSRPSCGVCTALKPKIETLLDRYPEIDARYVHVDEIPKAAGQLSVFTVPVRKNN